jgi:hypothetical protein
VAETVYGLNRRDRDKVDILLKDFARRQAQRNRDRVPDEDSQAPDVYIVRAPVSGVPALDDPPGTGSGTDDTYRPGTAVCDVYRIQTNNTSGTGTDGVSDYLVETNLDIRVYNVSGTAVPSLGFAVATRDKFGKWLLTSGPGNGSDTDPLTGRTVVAVVHLVASGTGGSGTDVADWYCQRVKRFGAGWVVSDGPDDFDPVVEMEGLQPRMVDAAANSSPGDAALAVTLLYQDEDGNYFVSYPLLSSSDTIQFPSAFVCVGSDIVPSAYTTVETIVDNYTDFPNISLRQRVV